MKAVGVIVVESQSAATVVGSTQSQAFEARTLISAAASGNNLAAHSSSFAEASTLTKNVVAARFSSDPVEDIAAASADNAAFATVLTAVVESSAAERIFESAHQ